MSDLGSLSDAWQRFGCAVCGTTVAHKAESGWRIELHHITPRGRGGGDEPENLMGLCGELLPNKCHWRVTTNRLKIAYEADLGGWVWTDPETGDADLCRMLTADTIASLNLDRPMPSQDVVKIPQSRVIIPEEYLPSPLHAEQGLLAAQERFKACVELVHRVERTWLALSLLVHAAMSYKDEVTLGMSQQEWADAVGISQPTVSRLRLVASQFQGSWLALPKQDRDNLSFEGLIFAARMVKWGIWERDRALSEAVAKPISVLWMDVKGYQEPEEMCECPKCGARHFTKEKKWMALQAEKAAEREGLTL